MQSLKIPHAVAREIRIYDKFDAAVPARLFEQTRSVPAETELDAIHVPLPSKKSDYSCFAKTNTSLWMGAKIAVVRTEDEGVGVDTPEDAVRVGKILESRAAK